MIRLSHSKSSQASLRSGLSLLEVILALTILGISVAAIGQLIRIGTINAEESENLSKAQAYCDSRMAEVAAGILPLSSVGSAPCEEDPEWLYSVQVSAANQVGLLQVGVAVTQDPTSVSNPLKFTIFRLMPDPEYVEQKKKEAEQVY